MNDLLFELATTRPLVFVTVLGILLLSALGLMTLGAKLLRMRRRADLKVAREARLRATWEKHARAVGLQPWDDETTDELMDRVMDARARGFTATELRREVRAAIQHPR